MELSLETKELLKQTYIKRLFAARFISSYGNGLSMPALAFGILKLKSGSTGELGLVLATFNVAVICMLPFGGVIADRFGRIKMVGACDIFGSLGLFVQAGFFATGKVPLPIMLIANGLFGLSAGIWWPAFTGVMPGLLPEKYLQKGNSINGMISNLSTILGAMSAGILLTLFGSAVPLFIDATSFFISGWIVFSFRHLVPGVPAKVTFFKEMQAGWKIFLSIKWIVYVVFGFSFIVFAASMIENVVGPFVFSKRPHGPLIWSSVILASETIGFLVGSIIAFHVHIKYVMRFLCAITFTLVFYLFAIHFPNLYPIIAVCAFFWGITMDLWGSLWTTALQRSVPREHLSRISAFDAMGSILFRPLGLSLAAPFIAWFGVSGVINIAAGIVLISIIVLLSSKEVRNMTLDKSTL
jgi:hypothetical protein